MGEDMILLDAVSVVVPCYNAEKWIVKTLESILAQTYENIEIVVVDDGSTDSTPNILKSYAHRGVKITRHEGNKNCGLSASLNLGIAHSTSNYIAFLDADDMWHPKKIETQLNYLLEHPLCALVYVNGWAVNEYDEIIYDLFPTTHRENNCSNEILLNCYIRTQGAVLLRRDVLKFVGVYDETLSAGDHDLWLRISESYNIAYIADQLMYYRRHPGQMSTGRKQWMDGFEILKKACTRYPYTSSIVRHRRAVLHYRLGLHCFAQGDYITGVLELIQSFVLDVKRSVSLAISLMRRFIPV